MSEKSGAQAGSNYEIRTEGNENVIYFNYEKASFVPSICEHAFVMENVVDVLMENSNVSRIVFSQEKNYNYGVEETNMLLELAQVYVFLTKQKRILLRQNLVSSCPQFFTQRYNDILRFVMLLKQHPVKAYYELKRILIEAKIALEKISIDCQSDQKDYIIFLEKILSYIENLKIIQNLKPYFKDFNSGDREIYYKIFQPDIIPNFTFTRLVSDMPENAEIIDQYEISGEDYDKSKVFILKRKNETKFLYYLSPPENSLDEDMYELLTLARGVLIEHQPKAEEFTDTQRTRQVFFNLSKDLIQDLSNAKNISLSYEELNMLAMILVRHTIGFGLVEVLLQDKKLHDISLNAPISMVNIFLRHQDYNECETNILPSNEDANSWAAKFRMISGRPLDESNPILDTQLDIKNISARIAIIQQPLSPDGLAYSVRRHREDPWTLPLFIKYKMLNSFAAGLLSFLIDGSRTMLIAGTRSSGKTSLLSSLMLEINPLSRIIVVEDTLELPVNALRKLRYDILRMKVRSALLKTGTEVSASDGIRTSLRLGDSCLIIGEVRSEEAKALYEAMRVGALANVVAGTIHGASPYGVFDRVVNDLGVPATSFKATDIIVVCNPVKSPDGLSSMKRVVSISEIRKHWNKDPLEEKGFTDLMVYDVDKDDLIPSDDLINGESEIIKDIAGNVKGWAGDWDAVYDNILLRAKIKQAIVDKSVELKRNDILESEFNRLANYAFHVISSEVTNEKGIPISDEVFPRFQKWLNKAVEEFK